MEEFAGADGLLCGADFWAADSFFPVVALAVTSLFTVALAAVSFFV